MYGAGSIGRGFIGPLFARAGYEVVFVDIDRSVIGALNNRDSYHFTVAADPPYDVQVCGAHGIDGADERAVLDGIASCDLMATALGAAALQKVAPTIAKGFSHRMRQSGAPLNLLICENLKDAAHLLRGWILEALPEDDRPMLDARFGLVEAAIGRMIPPGAGAGMAGGAGESMGNAGTDPLHLTVEEYGYLPVDKAAFVGEPPSGVPELIPYEPFSFYEERKLYLHNMGHAVCAYFGMRQGCTTIAQAASDPVVRLAVQNAMTEAAAMLSMKYCVPFARIFDHAEDLLYRFGNVALGDTCERVGRDPMRKLRAGDRLAGALAQCGEHEVIPVYIALGYAAALRHVTDDRARAEEIARGGDGRLSDDHARLVMKLYDAYPLPAPELLRAAERLKAELRGSTV